MENDGIEKKKAGERIEGLILKDNKCEACKKGRYFFSSYCGCYVCDRCGYHRGISQCYCGWSENGQIWIDDVEDGVFVVNREI